MLQKCAALIGAAGLVAAVACGQTDAGITTNIKGKMAADETVKAVQVEVDTRNGVVTLSGDVESAAAKDRAVQIARGTDGVRDVIDQVRVAETTATGGVVDGDGVRMDDRAVQDGLDAGAAVTDAAITSAVKARLLADPGVSGLRIDVDTQGAVVTLNGTVDSRAMADRAVTLVRNTDGVTRVVDDLRVEP